MEEAVVGAVVGATIQVVMQNLLSLPMEEIGLIFNFNDDLRKLKQSFLMLQDFLEDAETKQVADKPVQRWLMKLETLAFEADYFFDQINYQLLRVKVQSQRGSGTKNKVSSFFSNSIPVAFRYRMARKIKKIKNEMKSINQEATDLGLQMRIASSHAREAETNTPAYLESDSFSVDPIFIGRENDVAKIVEMVINSPTEEVVSVLPIVGMGGLGKTTLTRKVYNDATIISHFEKRMWVHVSDNSFDPLTVLKKIVESSMGENVDGSREVILQKLQKSLEDEKYLLVLDNVWNENSDKWENFMSSLKGISSLKGNVIVVTTRSRNVANIVKTLDVHELGILSGQDCWLIIKCKAFGGECATTMFETIGANIAKRCGGLPLAAQVVGGLLRGKPKHEWVSIEKNWLSNFGRDGDVVSNILKLSFDNLSSPSLKKCFALCSIFPKGCWIYKDELIHVWMAEGFLQIDRETNMEMVGKKVLNILLQSSLLQVRRRDLYGDVRHYYGMHDLVHNLASSILYSTFLDDSHQVRYLSTSFMDKSSPISNEHVESLRALFFNYRTSNIMLSKLTCVHVLILDDWEMRVLPNEIGKLVCLRLIDISHTRIECLPDSIGELYRLQTLRTNQYILKKLPNTLKFLISLRHLSIPNIELPPEIGKLTSLQSLPYFQVGDQQGCGIRELGSLKNLKGEIQIHNLEIVRDKEEAKTADLFHKTSILRLKFVWKSSRKDDHNNDENVLEGLQPHPNLESLKIQGFKGCSFPSWTLRMEVIDEVGDRWLRLDNLLEIELSTCEECEEIPMMGQLSCLKILCLYRLSKVKSISSSFYGIKENSVHRESVTVFPALETLQLIDMANLTTWEEVELSGTEALVFPRLVYLKIDNCRQLKSTPTHFPSLNELEIWNMESGIPLASICGSKLTTLKKLRICGVDGLVCLPDGLFSSNRDLLELNIKGCNKLMHLVPCLGDGGVSLRMLEIVECSNFEKLPEDLYKLNALEGLILNCPNLKSIAYTSCRQLSSLRFLRLCCSNLTYFPCEMLHSSLMVLNLTGSKSATNLPEVIRFVHEKCRLIELGIAFVPKLPEVVAEIGSLRSLQLLTIGGSSDCSDYMSFTMILDRIFPPLQSLRVLALCGMEEWDGFPDQLQHLTALHTLTVDSFGIEVVPEWLDRLSSLRDLGLFNCQKLRDLPSRKATGALTKLRIFHCPLLKKNLDENAIYLHSGWHKAYHIRNIEVDGRPFPPRVQI